MPNSIVLTVTYSFSSAGFEKSSQQISLISSLQSRKKVPKFFSLPFKETSTKNY